MEQYLKRMLGGRKAEEVVRAVKTGKTIVITGQEKTGKTTLCNYLKSIGGNVVEDFDVCEIRLEKPLDHVTPNLITSLVQGNVEKY